MIYQSKRLPRHKQAEALNRIEDQKVFGLLMSMRTGKTKVILDDWQRTVNEVPNLLVIAPAGVYRTWQTALQEDIDDRLLDKTAVYVWESGESTAPELKRFLGQHGPRVLLVNIEALSTIETIRSFCTNFLQQRKTMLVVDESVTIKNHNAKRTKFINQRLAPLAAYRRILSGLPTPRSPLDLYCQFEFLDPRILGFKNYFAFRKRYAVLKKMRAGGHSFDVVVGYQHVDELQQKIAPHSIRVRLEDCYDLPPSTYMVREIALTKEQARIYGELKQFATAKLAKDQHVTATAVITQMLRLHQVLCGHCKDEAGNYFAIPERRTASLLELLEDYDGDKAVIWCSYDADVRKVAQALSKEYGERSVARFWGGNKDTREAEELQFKNNEACRFMVATAAAGGRGRTWDIADLVVYYSNNDNLDYRMQSEDRVKNVGKAKAIAYVDLMVPGTVDEKIIKALRNKINMAATITGDNYQEWLV
jgi:SNF2 family DNA or RNA helicase